MSDLEKSNKSFEDAVAWSLPEVSGVVVNKHSKPEQRVEIDDIKLFEARIQKQIEKIKKQQDEPTYLTVKQIEDVQKQAYDEAYQQGYEEAYKKGTEDSEAFIEKQLAADRAVVKQNAQQLQKCFNLLARPLDDVDQDIEQQLTETVFYFCKQLLAHELSVDSSHIFHLMQQATSRLPVAQRQILVKLNPADIALLEENDIHAADHGWTFEADTSIVAGGCIIDTEVSSIDLSLEDRLKEITEQLFSGLKQPDDISLSKPQGQTADAEITDD